MKIKKIKEENVKLLKSYITTLLKEESDVNSSSNDLTFGELKKIISVYTEEKGIEKNINKRKDIGKSAMRLALDFVPFAGAASTTVELIGKLMNIEDTKKPKGFAGMLDIDDYISQIVDNSLEVEFLKWFTTYLNDKDDNEKVKNFNITDKLKEFLARKFDGRSITGYK